MNNKKTISKVAIFAVAAFFVLVINMSAWGQVLVGYDFTGSNTGVATFAPTTTAPNVNSSNLSRGPGAPPSNANNSFRTTGFQNNGIATTNTDYFQTTISAPAGFTLSLSSLTANLAGTASFAVAPGVTSQFAYSLDGTTFTLIGSPQANIGTPQSLTVDLTGVAALQNVASGISITFRYYASGQTATGGWGFISAAPGTNGFAINGTSLSPTAAGTTVGGRVVQPNGSGIRNASVRVLDSQGVERTVVTDGQGNYQFENVPSGLVYVFSVAHLRYQFAEPTQVQFIGEDVSGINFVGTIAPRFGDLFTIRNSSSKEPE